MSKKHSGFAQFTDAGQRDEFVKSVLAGDDDLNSHAYLSGSQPTIVFDNLTAGDYKKVRSALEGRGRWVEDIQFETMG